MTRRFYEKLLEWTQSGRRVAVATIVETVGSTPRKTGTKMLVSDRMELYGTVGGGCVEADVIFAAREALRTLTPRTIQVDIKAKNADELDMLCGGEITFFVEPVMPECRLLICGGGHISKALAEACRPLEFHTVILDDREQFANQDRFPYADEVVCCGYAEFGEKLQITPWTFAVVVTRGHSGDEACLRSLLKSEACYIGMIGSRAKWANVKARLRDAGFAESALDRVQCPAGLDISSITPEEIAISIAAELIQRRARLRTPASGAPADA